MSETNTPTSYLYEKYQQEIEEIAPFLLRLHANLEESKDPRLVGIRRRTSGNVAGTTPFADALYLYLLVRELNPKTIFEIGTWVGTSALFMAEAMKRNGGGCIYTCDDSYYYILPAEYDQYVTYLPGHSDAILKQLSDQGKQFDLVFVDGIMTRKTRALLRETTHTQTAFAIHDFLLPDDKGIRAFLMLPSRKNYSLFIPQPFSPGIEKGSVINKMTAVFIPHNTFPIEVTGGHSGLSLQLFQYYLFISYGIGRIVRKLFRLPRRTEHA